MSDFANLYPYGLPIYDPQWIVPQQPNHEPEWLARLVGLEAERDVAVKRAEAAEAKLREWETAAANNDPYLTNGGYVEVEVLEAVKRRNSELLTRAEAAEAALAAVPVDAILALNGPDDYDFTGLISDIEKFAAWLEPLRAQRKVAA